MKKGAKMTPKGRPTVVIADDHVGMQKWISEVLADECNILAIVNDGSKAVRAAVEFKPDVVILDLFMPGVDGIHAAQEMRRLGVPAKLIIISVQDDAEYVEIAGSIGAGYVVKTRIHVDLSLAVKEVLAGRTFVSPLALISSRKPEPRHLPSRNP